MFLLRKVLNNKLAIFLVLTSVTSLLFFSKLLWEIIEKGRITLLDQTIENFVYTIRTPFLTNIMLAITSLGNTYQVGFICIIAFIILYSHKKYKYILVLFTSLLVNTIFVNIVKNIVDRARPSVQYALVVENNFSFPSGHTIVAVCFYGVIAYFIYRSVRKPWHKYLTLVVSISLIILIGISRIYLGVHWPTDVLGSYALGISWFSFLILIIHYRLQIGNFLKSKNLLPKIK